MSPAAGVVTDHTALSLLGRGHPFLSGLVAAAAPLTGSWHVFVPALCLAAAIAERPALGEHVLALPAVAVCRPDPEWPTGRPVITATPDQYDGLFVDVIAVN